MTRSVAIALAAACGACGADSHPGASDAAPSPADAGVMVDAPPGQSGPHPFGTHGGYVTGGVIFPSNHSQADLDAATAAFYDAWKARYLVDGCAAGEKRVKSAGSAGAYTVSEGHGYGMLIAAIMEGHDPDAHAIFDGLYQYYDAHRSQNNHDLMAWAQDETCKAVDGADSATDGDLDIAYALLLADRQWGSSGAIDYHGAAAKIIAAIGKSDLHPSGSILVGDWAGSGDPHYTGTRPSDFMIDHLRAFAAVDSGPWMHAVDHTYELVAYLQAKASMKVGLLPDFAINATGEPPTPAAAPGNWLEGGNDGHYGYNACRVPWRLATDYLMWGDPRGRDAVREVEAWIRSKTGDVPSLIRDGYKLDGSVTGSDPTLPFVAPFAVGAMIEPATGTNQAWLNAGWDEVAGRPPGEYYGDSIKLLAMIVMSGNWWKP